MKDTWAGPWERAHRTLLMALSTALGDDFPAYPKNTDPIAFYKGWSERYIRQVCHLAGYKRGLDDAKGLEESGAPRWLDAAKPEEALDA